MKSVTLRHKILIALALASLPELSLATGIIIEKTFPWDTQPSGVEEYSSETTLLPSESGYKAYFLKSDGRRVGVEKKLIIKIIGFLDSLDIPQILDQTELAKLSAERDRLLEAKKEFPIAARQLQLQISMIDDQLTKFRAGYRKIQGKWLDPNQYKAYQLEQERLSAETKTAEEKRKAEIKGAQEKQEREERDRQERLARANEERARAVRLAKEKLEVKKTAIIGEATRFYEQMENSKIKADQLEIACIEKLSSTPKRRVTGQVFIATKGAESYKFGAITVSIFSRQAIDEITASCKAFEHELFRLARDWKRAHTDQGATEKTESPVRILNSFPRLEDAGAASIYFLFLPKPLAETETDADGRFNIDVPIKEDFVVAALAHRNISQEIEINYWLVPLKIEDESDERLLLSNNNVMHDVSLRSMLEYSLLDSPSD